jgi:hypothetical protein
LTAVAGDSAGAESVPVNDNGGNEPTESEPDIAPEQVGELAELGVRLPGAGINRAARGDQDTDEDLF